MYCHGCPRCSQALYGSLACGFRWYFAGYEASIVSHYPLKIHAITHEFSFPYFYAVFTQGGVGAPPPPGALGTNQGPCPYAPDITAADCPANSCFAGPPNGCGSRSLVIISAQIVPDQWPAGVDFNQACNAHDTCYFTPGTQKADCDNKFHDALLAECQRALR